MATNDQELIREVRGFTDTGVDMIPGDEMQVLVDIGKEEIRSDIGKRNQDFYKSNTLPLDRALFWFTCLATKVKLGEVGSANFEIEDITSEKPGQGHFDIWFKNLEDKLRQWEFDRQDGGPAQKQFVRDGRTYGE